jgi:hypothetical protein
VEVVGWQGAKRRLAVLVAGVFSTWLFAVPAQAGHGNGYVPPDNQFTSGAQVTMHGTNCSVLGNPYSEPMLNAFAHYTPNRKVGEVWWLRLVVYKTGNNCGGAESFNNYVQAIPNTFYAISDQYPVKCEYSNFASNGPWQDITGQQINSQAYGNFTPCTRNSASNGMVLPQGGAYRITIPVVSKRPLVGSGSSTHKSAWIVDGATTDANPNTSGLDDGNPFVWTWVADNPPQVVYGNPHTTSIGSASARSTATLYTYYRPGTMFVEIGKTTSYGRTDITHAATDNDYGFTVDHTWQNLEPNTTYHWRVRFRDFAGQTFSGPDQTFTTPAAGTAPPGGGGGGTPPGDGGGGGTPPGDSGGTDPVTPGDQGGTDVPPEDGGILGGPTQDEVVDEDCAEARQALARAKARLKKADGQRAIERARAKVRKAKAAVREACG